MHDRHVPRQELVEGLGALLQHPVEHRRLERRDHQPGAPPVAPQAVVRQDLEPALDVLPVAPETLAAEPVGQTPALEPRQDLTGALAGFSVDPTHHQPETIAPELPHPQAFRVPLPGQHAGSFDCRRAGPGDLGEALAAGHRHREPLAGDREAILAPGVAHLAPLEPEGAGQGAQHVVGGALALLDPHMGVGAVAQGRKEGDLFDLEIFGLGTDTRHVKSDREQRFAIAVYWRSLPRRGSTHPAPERDPPPAERPKCSRPGS